VTRSSLPRRCGRGTSHPRRPAEQTPSSARCIRMPRSGLSPRSPDRRATLPASRCRVIPAGQAPLASLLQAHRI
jgi:hypothetical protein